MNLTSESKEWTFYLCCNTRLTDVMDSVPFTSYFFWKIKGSIVDAMVWGLCVFW